MTNRTQTEEDSSTKFYGIIYLILNKINGKYYVGQTVQGQEVRWQKHLSDSIHRSLSLFGRAIQKYGPENFRVETLCECPDQESLDSSEVFFIQFLGSWKRSFGYNIDKGGKGKGRILVEETKEKIRKGLLGKPHSPERNKKTADTKRGKKHSEEHKNHISSGLKGKTKGIKRGPLPEATRKKMMGPHQKWEYGQVFTEEMKQNMTEAQIKRREKYIRERERLEKLAPAETGA